MNLRLLVLSLALSGCSSITQQGIGNNNSRGLSISQDEAMTIVSVPVKLKAGGYSSEMIGPLPSAAEATYSRLRRAGIIKDVFPRGNASGDSHCSVDFDKVLTEMRSLFAIRWQTFSTGQRSIIPLTFGNSKAYWVGTECNLSTARSTGTLVFFGSGSARGILKEGYIRAKIEILNGIPTGSVYAQAEWVECESNGFCKYRYDGSELGNFGASSSPTEGVNARLNREAAAHNAAVNGIVGTVATRAAQGVKEMFTPVPNSNPTSQSGTARDSNDSSRNGGVKRIYTLSSAWGVECKNGVSGLIQYSRSGGQYCGSLQASDSRSNCTPSVEEVAAKLCR